MALNKTESINVLDFGGGGGYHYFLVKQFFPELKALNWRVVETVKMVQEAKRIADHQLTFFDSIIEAKNDLGKVDLVFTSGALQCCPNPYDYLCDLLQVGANYIYISRTAFIEEGDEVCIIHHSNISDNGPGPLPKEFKDASVRYPVVFLNKSKAEKIMQEEYNIIMYIEEEKGAYQADKMPINMYGYFLAKKNII